MEIIILGTGCSRCKALETAVRNVVATTGLEATVRKEEDMERIMEYNVMSLPALVVDGQVAVKGRVPGEDELRTILGL